MLDRTGNAESYIYFRMNGLAGLSYLVVSGKPAGVDNDTGTAQNAVQLISQFLAKLDAELDILSDTTAYRNDVLSADKVNQLLCCLLNGKDLGLEIALSSP